MQTAVYNGNKIIAFEVAAKSEVFETSIRQASAHSELKCPDPECRSVVIYKHGKEKGPHFAHKTVGDCDYEMFERQDTKIYQEIRRKIYTYLKKQRYNVTIETKVIPHHITHLMIECNNEKIAIELCTAKITSSKVLELEKQYRDLNIRLFWFVVDDTEQDIDENDTCFIFRHILEAEENNELFIISEDGEMISQRKLFEDSQIECNGVNYYIKESRCYKRISKTSELYVQYKGKYIISSIGFDSEFNKWSAAYREDLIKHSSEYQLHHPADNTASYFEKRIYADAVALLKSDSKTDKNKEDALRKRIHSRDTTIKVHLENWSSIECNGRVMCRVCGKYFSDDEIADNVYYDHIHTGVCRECLKDVIRFKGEHLWLTKD